jgi:hypothetical protein
MMDITRRMDITGMSVVPGGRGAGGNLVTTGIIGRIDIITGRMDITDRIDAIATGEIVLVESIAPRRHRCHLVSRSKRLPLRLLALYAHSPAPNWSFPGSNCSLVTR